MARKGRRFITFLSEAASECLAPLAQAVRQGTADPRARAAAHEAGHALVAWSSMHVSRVKGARLRGLGDGTVNFDIRDYEHLHSAAWDAAVISLAGLAGEIVAFGSVRSGDSEDDLLKARETAGRIASGEWRRPWTAVPGEGLDIAAMFESPPSADVASVLRQCYLRARHLIVQRSDLFERLRRELLSRGEIDEDGIARLLGPRPWATIR